MSDTYLSAERSMELTSFSRRIMYITTSTRLLYNGTTSSNDFDTYNASYSAYPVDRTDLKYFRIKNLDTTNQLYIALVDATVFSAADGVSLRIFPGEIMTIYEGDSYFDAIENTMINNLVTSPNDDLIYISCKASTGTIAADVFLGYDQE